MSDVLHSVRKMEESLKRLKQARKSTPANPGGSSGGGMSDDDKIRLQLALDVEYLGDQVTGSASAPGTLEPNPRVTCGSREPRDAIEGPGKLFPRAGKRGRGPKSLEYLFAPGN